MENENNENSDSQTEETAEEFDNLDAAALKEIALKERTQRSELEAKNRQLFERAKKAEGFEKDEDGNWIKYIEKISKEKPKAEKKPEKSGDIDYGLLAFYNSKTDSLKIEHEDDVSFLKKSLDEFGKPLTELLQNKYFLGELKDRQEMRAVKEATPSSTGRTGVTKKDVSYWLSRPYHEVPESMKNAVLDALKNQQV